MKEVSKHSSSRYGGYFQAGSQAGAAKQPGEVVTGKTAFQPNKPSPGKLFLSLGKHRESQDHAVKTQSYLGLEL